MTPNIKKLFQDIDLINWKHLGKSQTDIILHIRLPEYDKEYIDYVVREVLRRLQGTVRKFRTEWEKGRELLKIEEVNEWKNV